MGALDNAWDIAKKVGNQAWDMGATAADAALDVGEGFADGMVRNAQGLGISGTDRQIEIATENEILARLIYNAVKNGATLASNPMVQAVAIIVGDFMARLPEEQQKAFAMKAGITLAPDLIAKQVGKKLAKEVIKRVALKIAGRISARVAATTLFKKITTRIAVSAGTSATGVGIPIGLTLMQGTAQKASDGSKTLKTLLPGIWQQMRHAGGLDMLFFLIESHVEPFTDLLVLASKNEKLFLDAVESVKWD